MHEGSGLAAGIAEVTEQIQCLAVVRESGRVVPGQLAQVTELIEGISLATPVTGLARRGQSGLM